MVAHAVTLEVELQKGGQAARITEPARTARTPTAWRSMDGCAAAGADSCRFIRTATTSATAGSATSLADDHRGDGCGIGGNLQHTRDVRALVSE